MYFNVRSNASAIDMGSIIDIASLPYEVGMATVTGMMSA